MQRAMCHKAVMQLGGSGTALIFVLPSLPFSPRQLISRAASLEASGCHLLKHYFKLFMRANARVLCSQQEVGLTDGTVVAAGVLYRITHGCSC